MPLDKVKLANKKYKREHKRIVKSRLDHIKKLNAAHSRNRNRKGLDRYLDDFIAEQDAPA